MVYSQCRIKGKCATQMFFAFNVNHKEIGQAEEEASFSHPEFHFKLFSSKTVVLFKQNRRFFFFAIFSKKRRHFPPQFKIEFIQTSGSSKKSSWLSSMLDLFMFFFRLFSLKSNSLPVMSAGVC